MLTVGMVVAIILLAVAVGWLVDRTQETARRVRWLEDTARDLRAEQERHCAQIDLLMKRPTS